MPYPSLDKDSRLIRGERPIQMRVLPQQGLIHFSCVLARQSRGVEQGRIFTPVPL